MNLSPLFFLSIKMRLISLNSLLPYANVSKKGAINFINKVASISSFLHLCHSKDGAGKDRLLLRFFIMIRKLHPWHLHGTTQVQKAGLSHAPLSICNHCGSTGRCCKGTGTETLNLLPLWAGLSMQRGLVLCRAAYVGLRSKESVWSFSEGM